jgi:glycosyltransferase involved in cell wall biosynthesis
VSYHPSVSVIIPTYNRKEMLLASLQSLALQSFPSDGFEVIIVDDGSTDGTRAIETHSFPFDLRYFWQPNGGDAVARNYGAEQSRSDILVFIDDDIVVEPDFLTCLIREHEACDDLIVVGAMNSWIEGATPLASAGYSPPTSTGDATTVPVAFTEVFSNSMSVRREAYFRIGPMDGLGFSGSSMWCDVDFAYRAHQQGFRFVRSNRARYWHHDFAVRSLNRLSRRLETAAFRAVVLFQRYPELQAYLPMFQDKTPIRWGVDPIRLTARKVARGLASTRPALWVLEQLANLLQKHDPGSALLANLCRYIVGGYIYQGFRQGLRHFGPSVRPHAKPAR